MIARRSHWHTQFLAGDGGLEVLRLGLDTLALHALMKATHLLGLAFGERLRQYRDSGDRVLDRFASLQEHALHVATLQEAIEIHGAHWDKAPERQRPHYPPEARFRIVRLKNLLALSAVETARLFRVSTSPPIRRYADPTSSPQRRSRLSQLARSGATPCSAATLAVRIVAEPGIGVRSIRRSRDAHGAPLRA